jgi:iron transport multicopper oxidase
MKPSFSGFLAFSAILPLLSIVNAATIEHDFDIEWMYANPDGRATRPVIGINGQWPIPQIEVTKGDRVIVHAHNKLGNESTSLHFHGLYQNGTSQMDGPPGVTQCEVRDRSKDDQLNIG